MTELSPLGGTWRVDVTRTVVEIEVGVPLMVVANSVGTAISVVESGALPPSPSPSCCWPEVMVVVTKTLVE